MGFAVALPATPTTSAASAPAGADRVLAEVEAVDPPAGACRVGTAQNFDPAEEQGDVAGNGAEASATGQTALLCSAGDPHIITYTEVRCLGA